MIEATVAMAAMAGLFVAFGLMRVADREGGHGCGHAGGCDTCPNASNEACFSGTECDFQDTGVSS